MPASDRSRKLVLIAIAASFVLAAVVSVTRARAPVTRVAPVRLGTNELRRGALLFNRSGTKLGTVLEIDPWYEFADGTDRAGVRVKAANGAEVWTPRDQMRDVLVIQ